jgi:hypothetical protein
LSISTSNQSELEIVMKKQMPAKGMPKGMPGKMAAADPKGKMPAKGKMPKGYKSGGMMGGKKGC